MYIDAIKKKGSSSQLPPFGNQKSTVMLSNSIPLVKGKDIAFTIQPQVGSTRAQAILSSLVNRFCLQDASDSKTLACPGYVYQIPDKPGADKLARTQHSSCFCLSDLTCLNPTF